MATNPEGGAVLLIDYDPRWPREFEEEKARVLAAIGPHVVGVEHIGSTAVPGLPAKPIIDLLVGVRRLDEARPCIAPLAAIGYAYVPEYEAFIPDRRYFRKGAFGARTHHLHMVVIGGEIWNAHVRFRDWLRDHPDDARRYADLKRELAAKFRDDREAYTDGKTAFIREIERRSLAAKPK